MDKLDKLGRKIPVFDRSAAGKKAAATRKLNEGQNVHTKDGTLGGQKKTRGYFGYLKDTDPEKLKRLSQEAAERRAELADGASQTPVPGDK